MYEVELVSCDQTVGVMQTGDLSNILPLPIAGVQIISALVTTDNQASSDHANGAPSGMQSFNWFDGRQSCGQNTHYVNQEHDHDDQWGSTSYSAPLFSPRVFNGLKCEPIYVHPEGQHDEVVVVKLSGPCFDASFAIYGSDRDEPTTDLRHIRAAWSMDGRTWTCDVQSDDPPDGGEVVGPVELGS